MLFVQCVVYNISDSDDGSCESCENEMCCLSLKSTLNSNENRCYWAAGDDDLTVGTNSSSGMHFCHFRSINQDMTRMFLVSLISAIVSAPISLSIQYLIGHVLSKHTFPSQHTLQGLASLPSHLSNRRQLSQQLEVANSNLNLKEESGGSLQEDMKNLLEDLSRYYEKLRNEDPSKAQEFRGKTYH